MPSKTHKAPALCAAIVALAALACLVYLACLTLFAPVASAEGCGRIGVKVSKHRVKPGQFVRVSGTTCAAPGERPGFVRIKLRTKSGWRQVGLSHTRRTGRFSRRIRVPAQTPAPATSHLQVIASDAQSPSVPIKFEEENDSNCPLKDPGYEVGATIDGCRVIASDTASNPNPLGFWGAGECGTYPNAIDADRPQNPTSDGDTHVTATGAPQGNDAYRRMTVLDGDDFYGERCELGLNNSDEGPTAFYREGDRRVTFVSLRLPDNFPLSTEKWQTILQMKQAQPANNGGGIPILFMGAFNDTFYVDSEHGIHWEFPAQKNVWTRFMFDVDYSRDASKGSIQVAADINDDGDFDDEGERSPRIEAQTLREETAGPLDEIAPGASIPSHLRAGIYHDPSIQCPPPAGCSTEIDNVQVVAP